MPVGIQVVERFILTPCLLTEQMLGAVNDGATHDLDIGFFDSIQLYQSILTSFVFEGEVVETG